MPAVGPAVNVTIDPLEVLSEPKELVRPQE
jgi:hypothetical protein